MRGVAGSAFLLEPHVFQIHTVEVRPQEFCYHVAVPQIVESYSIASLIFILLPKIRTKQWLVGVYLFLLDH